MPVAVLFLGIVADPEETHAVWYGMLNMLGIFDVSTLSDAENENYTREKHYFWFGEVMMAGILAGSIAVPAGIWFAGQTEISLAFIGTALLFLPLFVFMPKLIQHGMKADAEAAINAFGKNEQVKKVFWTLFIAMTGLMLARVVDPVTAQKVVGIITGIGGEMAGIFLRTFLSHFSRLPEACLYASTAEKVRRIILTISRHMIHYYRKYW